MSRKTHSISAAAIIAGTILIFAGSETTGASAQVSDQGVETVETAAPLFVSEEVVQPLPIGQGEGNTSQDNTSPSANSLKELVAQTESGQALSDELQCLAGAVYFESRGEPLAGQLAVAQVIVNRTDSGRFPSSYCGVVYQRAQFSFVKNGQMPQIRTGSLAWERAKAIARIAHEGLWESEAQDSLYFHAKYVRPAWTRKKVARATISSHVFYR
ncbi:MAG: cell wall hydrolase [Alphaproteobacteria bacterium]|nr:MAG: cell wall hydrolase [Alphaproteobacteria bacterium]